MPEKDIKNMTGTVESVGNMMLEVKTDDNQTWTLMVKPNAKVKITGKGNANSLCPGQTISFSATVSGKKITEKISKIAVVTSGGGGEMGPMAGNEKPKPHSKLGKNAEPSDSGGPTEMTGEVVKVTKSRLSLTVNGKKTNVELADDLEVTFDLEGPAALSSVSPGAKIDFSGKGQGNFPRAMVEDVKIEIVPGEAHAGKHAPKKPAHTKAKKSADDLDASSGSDDEPKKPAHHTRKKPKADADADSDKPADGGDATK
jgi:hypothetical protein